MLIGFWPFRHSVQGRADCAAWASFNGKLEGSPRTRSTYYGLWRFGTSITSAGRH